MSPIDVLGAICIAVALASIGYWFVSATWLNAFFRGSVAKRREEERGTAEPCPLPPVTFFRPLKPGVVDLQAKLHGFVEGIRGHDQLLFGVEPGTHEARLCAEIVRTFPGKDLAVITCDRNAASNPKIANLLQMTPSAKHGHWMILDGEFIAEPGWLERFRSEWIHSGKDAFTAGYRFAGITTFLQALDAIPILLSLWPGLGTVFRNEQLGFTLGAVIALRRDDLEAIGGWQRFSSELAEDNRLGATLSRAGKTVGLSREIATLASDSLSWRDYWRHQRRVAVTYRVCNPAGFAGMICTHGISFAFILVLLKPVSQAAWLVMGATVAFRWWTAHRLSTVLQFPILDLRSATLIASVIETTCWIAAWLSTTVWWAGRKWQVRKDGKLEPEPSH